MVNLQDFFSNYVNTQTILEELIIVDYSQEKEAKDYSNELIEQSIFLMILHQFVNKKNERITNISHSNVNLQLSLPTFLNEKNKQFFARILNYFFPKSVFLENHLDIDEKEKISRLLIHFLNSFKWDIHQTKSFSYSDENDRKDYLTPDIFETIYEFNNKTKEGLVHTPPIASNFMVKNSLSKFLSEKVQLSSEDIYEIEPFDNPTRKILLDVLPKIKVLDISVGCGSFFLSVFNILSDFFRKLDLNKIETLSQSDFIIRNCIFGVDIDEKTIRICKIRLFLNLISQQSKLDLESAYKSILNCNLKVGNSIIGYIKPIQNKTTLDDFISEKTNEIQKQNSATKDKFTKNLVKNQKLPSINKNKIFHWFLEFPEIFANPKNVGFDIVIGNPPYIGYGSVSKEEKKLLKILFPEIYTGLNDYYYYFIWRTLQLLKNGGMGSLIVSRYFLEARYAQKLREELLQNCYLDTLIDFKEYKIFPNHGINAIIFFLLKKPYVKEQECFSINLRNFKIDNKILFEFLQKFIQKPAIIQNKDFYTYHSSLGSLVNGEILFISQNVRSIVEKIMKNKHLLEDSCYVGTGYHTGRDAVFSKNIMMEDGVFFGQIKKEDGSIEKYELEKDLIKKIIKTTNILPFSLDWTDKFVILTQHDINIMKYPLTLKYLSKFKTALEERYECKNKVAKWYEIAQIRNQHIFDANEKIFCPYRTKTPRFAIDKNKMYSSIDCTLISLKRDSKINIYYILGLLNSELVEFFLYAITKKLDARKIELYPKTISKIPIIFPKSSNEKIICQKITDVTERIYKALDSYSFSNLDKNLLIAKGKRGFLEIENGTEQINEDIQLLDDLVYELYGMKSEKSAIKEEVLNIRP